MNGPRDDARLAVIAEHKARRAELISRHGMPEIIAPSDALALAMTGRIPIDPAATADDLWAGVYRDAEAAAAWGESNRAHYGHPTLARVPLPDGRVVGILDLRPAMRRAQAAEVRP